MKSDFYDPSTGQNRTIKRNPEYDDTPYEITVTVCTGNKGAHMIPYRFKSMEDFHAFMRTGDHKYCVMPYIVE